VANFTLQSKNLRAAVLNCTAEQFRAAAWFAEILRAKLALQNLATQEF